MKFYGDYHTHTCYSDGKGSLSRNIDAAVERGLKEIAITEHGFRNPVYSWEKFFKEKNELTSLERKDISVLLGIEADIMDEKGLLDLNVDEIEHFDVLIAGFHMFALPYTFADWRRTYFPSIFHPFFENSPKYIARNTDSIIACLQKYPVDILAHPNHRMFADMSAVARQAAELGTFMEINIKHLSIFDNIVEDILKTDVKLIVDSDSHRPQDMGRLDKAEDIITKYGLQERIVNLDGRPQFRSHKEKENAR